MTTSCSTPAVFTNYNIWQKTRKYPPMNYKELTYALSRIILHSQIFPSNFTQ